MRSSGNSDPAVCANNLVRISRGEVPYDRTRGVKFAALTGTNLNSTEELQEDTKKMVEIYEPRVKVNSVDIKVTDAALGQIEATVNIEEASNG